MTKTVWLWPEAGQVRVFTADETRVLSGPPSLSPPPPDAHLRAGKMAEGLSQCLQPDLAGVLVRALESGPVELRLTADVPPEWRDYPYEWLQYQGQPVQNRMVVVRDAPRSSAGATALAIRKAALLDLWPTQEAIQPTRNLPTCPGLERKPGHLMAHSFMATANLLDYGLLIVVAHGSERGTDIPFRLENGEGWSLPTARGLPPLVILLACGSEDGNLLDYGRQLLAEGAKTVLAPRGKLDARGARVFLETFLPCWQEGHRVATALHLAQQADQTEHYGAARLRLLGEAGLRLGASEEADFCDPDILEKRVLADLQADQLPADLLAWCERLTLKHYQLQGNLDQLERLISKNEEAALLRHLHPVLERLPHLTQSWVMPYLAYLAEYHDHHLLASLQQQRQELESRFPGKINTPSYHRHWAKLHYRQGYYALAAREVAAGLIQLKNQEQSPHAVGLLGTLLNILIDQTLAQPALCVEQELDVVLDRRTDKEAEDHRKKKVDRLARLELREGNPDRFNTLYHRRWQNDPEDERALAWLLYGAAWYPVECEKKYLEAVSVLLDDLLKALTPQGVSGNANTLYLLRALATWVWCRDDMVLAERLAVVIPFCSHRLLNQPHNDPGPIAFILAYLHLFAVKHHPDWQVKLPAWDTIMTALHDGKYYLEETAFCYLIADYRQVKRHLNSFHGQRRGVIKELSSVQLNLQLEGSLSEQELKEKEVFLQPTDQPVYHLLNSGLLPL